MAVSKWFTGEEALSNDQHHNELEGWSSSQLKTILSESPSVFYEKYIAKTFVKDDEENENFRVGTIIHEAILEPEKFEKNVVYTAKGQKTKLSSEVEQEQNPEDKKKKPSKSKNPTLIVEPHNHIVAPKLRWVIDRARKNCENNPLLKSALKHGVPEISGTAEVKGVRYKIRPDLHVYGDTIYDIKTCQGLSNYKLLNAIIMYYYMLSASLYLNVTKVIDGKDAANKFVWIFIDKSNGEVRTIDMSEEMKKAGDVMMGRAVKTLKNCIQSGEWKTADQINGLVQLKLPSYFSADTY